MFIAVMFKIQYVIVMVVFQHELILSPLLTAKAFTSMTQCFLPEELQTASSPPRCSQCPPAGWPSVLAHTAASDAQHHTAQTESGTRMKFQTHGLEMRKHKGATHTHIHTHRPLVRCHRRNNI